VENEKAIIAIDCNANTDDIGYKRIRKAEGACDREQWFLPWILCGFGG
jgi:hypothetical protein